VLSTTPKISFTQITKHPLVYALVIMALIAGYFVHSFTGSSEERIKDCTDQVIYLRTMNDKKDSFILNLRTELAVKDLLLKSVPGIVDSIAKEKKSQVITQ